MRLFKLLTLILISSISIYAQDLPKDTLWTKFRFYPTQFLNAQFSNDSKLIYANILNGTLVLNAKNGDSIDFYPEPDKMGYVVAESENGQYIINRHSEKYDTKSKKLLWKCPYRNDSDFVLFNEKVSENGKIMVLQYKRQINSKSNDSTNIDIYDAEKEVFLRSIKIDTAGWVGYTLAISNDAKYLVMSCFTKISSITYTYQRYLYNAENGELIMKLNSTEDWQSPYMFSPKSNYFILRDNGFSYGYILFVNLKTMQKEYYNNASRSSDIFITKDEKYLVFGGSFTVSGLYVMYLGDSISNLNSKPLISIGEKLNYHRSYYFNKMSNNKKYLIAGINDYLYCLDFEKVLAGVTTQIKSGISLYPNPTKDKLILSNPQNHQINTLTAYDILGRTYPLSANGNEVDVSVLAASRYFLKVGLADGSFLDFEFVKE